MNIKASKIIQDSAILTLADHVFSQIWSQKHIWRGQEFLPVWTIHYRGLDFCLAGHIGPTNTWSTEITTTFGQFLDWASLLTVKKKKVNNEAQTKINFGRKLCSIYVASEWIGGRGSRDVSPASFISLSTSEESIIWKLPSRQHKKVDHSSCQSFSMMVNSFCPCSHTAV